MACDDVALEAAGKEDGWDLASLEPLGGCGASMEAQALELVPEADTGSSKLTALPVAEDAAGKEGWWADCDRISCLRLASSQLCGGSRFKGNFQAVKVFVCHDIPVREALLQVLGLQNIHAWDVS